MEKLVKKVIEQIKEDLRNDDLTALEEMLMNVSREDLEAYLSE